ncbi:hypothetical protein QV06_00495 [Gallibacterium genomosp. 3]|uniref:Uncharacterized protein n=1 Tax=Gallibacterium genomosp. 3 TaxID=505345 RepID=A0A1A7PVZ5_9PAST|nr:hypothetical protein [Gallibacterium genomosp. 3]OBX05916.1 hypothetical protein QV06_00495 [Gallibacterium genomosp. 3]
MKIKQKLNINREIVDGSIYYFTENCLGYLGLCKYKPRAERVRLLAKAGRQRKAAAEFMQLRARINKTLAATYITLH